MIKKIKIIIVSLSLLLLAGCLDKIASDTLYALKEANQLEVMDPAPSPLKSQWVENSDGSKTHIWFYKHISERVPVVIYFHGNASNVQHHYESGFIDKMRLMNIHFIIFDYPKYGLSKGNLNEKGVLQSGQNAIDFAKKEFPMSRIILWGRSLGAAPAAILAEKNQDYIDRLLLTSPWNSFWKLIERRYHFSESMAKSAARGNRYESDVAAKNFWKPVWIHHGDKDEVIPYELGVRLFESFQSKDKKLITVLGAGHNNLLTDKEWGEIEEFIFPVSMY